MRDGVRRGGDEGRGGAAGGGGVSSLRGGGREGTAVYDGVRRDAAAGEWE